MIKNILITGGTGYMGSHTAVYLLDHGYNVTIVDNLSNSHKKVYKVIEKLTSKNVDFFEADLRDEAALSTIFSHNNFDAVIHFAGYKAVGESVENPIKYYDNNVFGTIRLIEVMKKYHVNNLVFSSSATVYGKPEVIPITEDEPLKESNPYGKTKQVIESILHDEANADSELNCICLRYFNPLGAHPSGELGEEPNGVPKNLAPFITQVAVGKFSKLKVFGTDYPTHDGTCVRDYVHIMDLAAGHMNALDKLFNNPAGFEVFNLGSGNGYSVFDILHAFEKVIGKKIPYEVIDRRPGDVPELRADSTKANKILGWHQTKELNEMCQDAWNWQHKHPDGFASVKL